MHWLSKALHQPDVLKLKNAAFQLRSQSPHNSLNLKAPFRDFFKNFPPLYCAMSDAGSQFPHLSVEGLIFPFPIHAQFAKLPPTPSTFPPPAPVLDGAYPSLISHLPLIPSSHPPKFPPSPSPLAASLGDQFHGTKDLFLGISSWKI